MVMIDVNSEQFQEWLAKHEVPPPRLGGAFAYCPHQTMEKVKVPKKRALQTVYTPCKFKTRQVRKYARHYRRRHGEQAEQPYTIANADAKIEEVQVARKRKPKYPRGDVRRAKD
jgi:hypothetical protein